jgi:polyisoprenoid-binding protein YceI
MLGSERRAIGWALSAAMIAVMALRAGAHRVGSDCGTVQVRTYREGLAQRAGHDLIIEVGHWSATVVIGDEGALSSVELEVDSRSLQVREGLHGIKPLSDKDRTEIRKEIDEKVLRAQPIAFRSSAVESSDGQLTVLGELTMTGTTRPSSFGLDLAADGRVSGTLSVTQSEWGIKPYRGFLGALKVRDTVEVVIDVRLPTD